MPTLAAKKEGTPLSLPPLPYPEDALAPVISANTLRLHHGKHHQAYIATVNELMQEPSLRGSRSTTLCWQHRDDPNELNCSIMRHKRGTTLFIGVP